MEYCGRYVDLGRILKCGSAMEYNNEYKGIVNLHAQAIKLWTFKDPNVHSVSVRGEWNCSSPSSSHRWASCSSTILHLLSLLRSVTLPAWSLDASGCMPTVVLYFSRYCIVRLKVFSLFLCVCFLIYYLCEKYYKSFTVQHCIADCVSWVPRLTLLDLWTNWTNELALGIGLVCI